MRLTKYHKEAFVRAVMADVPKIDYQELARERVQKYALYILHDDVAALCAKDEKLKAKVTQYTYLPGVLQSVYATSTESDVYWLKTYHETVWDELRVMSDAYEAQRTARSELECSVQNAIAGCTTVKNALKMLPEFAEYLPVDVERTDNLPMISTIVASLTLAGWPKDAVAV